MRETVCPWPVCPFARGPFARGPFARGPFARGPFARGPFARWSEARGIVFVNSFISAVRENPGLFNDHNEKESEKPTAIELVTKCQLSVVRCQWHTIYFRSHAYDRRREFVGLTNNETDKTD